jgi:putative transcriptional regulator
MSGETIVARRRKSDGKLVRVFPDGREEPFPDPGPLPHLSEAEINAAALSDPDNPPLTPERLKRMKRVPQVKAMRRALHLTQEEFAARFQIPLGTLRDWEQGKAQPDQAARAYLKVIAGNPKAVMEALSAAPGSGRSEAQAAGEGGFVRDDASR